MLELYLISVCDSLNILSIILSSTCGLLCGIFGILYCCSYESSNYGDEEVNTLAKKVIKYAFPGFIVFTLLAVFVPSKSEALEIIGIGTIVDYVQSNNTLQQIPDKCINALDLYISEFTNPKK
jgi:hypothetical protein